ncbi:MAG: glycosyltransferase, partial [Lacisediminihabitans sp.]
IRAVARIKDRLDIRLRLAGLGKVERFERLADRLGIADRVTFLGLVPNGEIPDMMHAADAVVVPSRHSFPEGLPLTLYEALASRTPVIASDHPMFAGHLVHGESAMVFQASRPRALAHAIINLMTMPELYARISSGSPSAWQNMQNPVKWGEMLDHWLRGEPEDTAWLAGHTIAARDARADEGCGS